MYQTKASTTTTTAITVFIFVFLAATFTSVQALSPCPSATAWPPKKISDCNHHSNGKNIHNNDNVIITDDKTRARGSRSKHAQGPQVKPFHGPPPNPNPPPPPYLSPPPCPVPTPKAPPVSGVLSAQGLPPTRTNSPTLAAGHLTNKSGST